MPINILGISAYYHDSAAALVRDGIVVGAAQEERFTRKKHDPGFPYHSISYCLKEGGVRVRDLDQIVFYEKPLVKFERLLETYLAFAPRGFTSFISSMPIWLKEKLFMKDLLKKELADLGECSLQDLPPLLFTEHHHAHAASAFFPSPFETAAVLCLDGVGEWTTTSAWLGSGNELVPKWEIHFPHSLGLLYSAFTYYAGFKVNSGEYKLMGLAPYGAAKYVDLIRDNLVDIKDDGTFRLDMKYFDYATGLTMTNGKFDALFGGPPRRPETMVTQREMDLAKSVQVVTEEIILRLLRSMRRELGTEYLCLAGGVALNCVANGRILTEKIFKDIWIQPAAGDSGGALGAALAVWHQYYHSPRTAAASLDGMQGAYLGPGFTNAQVEQYLDRIHAKYEYLSDGELMPLLANILAGGNVVGWFQGRMEYGPRALGNRSIIADPRDPRMQSMLNLKIKYRESFRPFAPSVLCEKVEDFFNLDRPSPYMLLVADVRDDIRVPMTSAEEGLCGIEKLNVPRSSIPAVTHVDHSARIQTVHKETNPRYYALIDHFRLETGCPVLVNTSFNVRGEPIVCDMEDAYRCFMRTEMDYLVLENFLLRKQDQPEWKETGDWRKTFELD